MCDILSRNKLVPKPKKKSTQRLNPCMGSEVFSSGYQIFKGKWTEPQLQFGHGRLF